MINILDRTGEIGRNNFGTDMKIVAYRRYDDIDVEFLDEHHYVKEHNTYSNFKSGAIKNPYDRSVYGVGYVGEGNHIIIQNKKVSLSYEVWSEMLARCYLEERKHLHPAYFGIVTVCDEWQCYHRFADWYEEHTYECDGRLHLDKDILYPGNKEYSPEKCLLVPQRINMLFMNKPNKRGLPNGIIKYPCGYLAKYNQQELGIFPTVEEAYHEQTKKKKQAVVQIANEYKEVIPEKVYNALLAYEFRIENDKNYKVA